MHYDYKSSKAYVKHIGLFWDEEFTKRVDIVAFEYNITQEQLEVMVREYAWRIKCLFTPGMYTIWQRILLALHFLNPFAKGM